MLYWAVYYVYVCGVIVWHASKQHVYVSLEWYLRALQHACLTNRNILCYVWHKKIIIYFPSIVLQLSHISDLVTPVSPFTVSVVGGCGVQLQMTHPLLPVSFTGTHLHPYTCTAVRPLMKDITKKSHFSWIIVDGCTYSLDLHAVPGNGNGPGPTWEL